MSEENDLEGLKLAKELISMLYDRMAKADVSWGTYYQAMEIVTSCLISGVVKNFHDHKDSGGLDEWLSLLASTVNGSLKDAYGTAVPIEIGFSILKKE